MAKMICGFTREQAIKEILAAGWKPWYPVENIPLNGNMFWDGDDPTCGYAWGSAIHEILECQEYHQLDLFAPPNTGIEPTAEGSPLFQHETSAAHA